MRCTCRRFGALPNLRIRERCLTVAPAWASPSTPCPANNVIRSSLGLLNVCFALRLTALTTPGMYRYPCPQHAAAARRWCPESDLNQRPTAYEAVLAAFRSIAKHCITSAELLDFRACAMA